MDHSARQSVLPEYLDNTPNTLKAHIECEVFLRENKNSVLSGKDHGRAGGRQKRKYWEMILLVTLSSGRFCYVLNNGAKGETNLFYTTDHLFSLFSTEIAYVAQAFCVNLFHR